MLNKDEALHIRGLVESTGWALLEADIRRRWQQRYREVFDNDKDNPRAKGAAAELEWVVARPHQLLVEAAENHQRAVEEEQQRTREEHQVRYGVNPPVPMETEDE